MGESNIRGAAEGCIGLRNQSYSSAQRSVFYISAQPKCMRLCIRDKSVMLTTASTESVHTEGASEKKGSNASSRRRQPCDIQIEEGGYT